MKCIYYLAPTLLSVHRISDDLHDAGVSDFCLHVVAKDERGLKQEHIHSANYIETMDLVRDGLIGAAIGFLAGLVGLGLLQYFEPFGPDVPAVVYLAVVAAATLFGAWVGGLTGVDSENKKLRKFHAQIDAGQYLILVYVRKHQERAVLARMQANHPEAQLAGIDTHFFNPFSSVTPVEGSASVSKSEVSH
jgi:hypothetical protein